MDIAETKTIGKYRIDIELDIEPQDPREDDNLGTMVCFHGGYDLGDKEHGYDQRDTSSWDELKEVIRTKENATIILPLFLYDHSGITMNTTGFSCPWDSGQVGFIFISREKMIKEYGVQIDDELIERVTKYLVNEVKTYDQYLTGDVYGYCITELDDNGEDVEQVDSCWGYYGSECCMDEAQSVVNNMIENWKKELEKFPLYVPK